MGGTESMEGVVGEDGGRAWEEEEEGGREEEEGGGGRWRG